MDFIGRAMKDMVLPPDPTQWKILGSHSSDVSPMNDPSGHCVHSQGFEDP